MTLALNVGVLLEATHHSSTCLLSQFSRACYPLMTQWGGDQISSYNSIIITVGRKRKLRTRFIIGNYIARSKMPFYEFLGNYGAHQLVLKVASILMNRLMSRLGLCLATMYLTYL